MDISVKLEVNEIERAIRAHVNSNIKDFIAEVGKDVEFFYTSENGVTKLSHVIVKCKKYQPSSGGRD